jgi:hypothetical protein
MRVLAIIAVLGLLLVDRATAQPKPESDPPTITGIDTSAIVFDSFTIENTTGIPMTVTLEAPIGTVVVASADVAPSSKGHFDPQAKNASSARIIANFGKDHGKYSQDTTLDGKYIKTMTAVANIGEVKITELVDSGSKASGK